MEKSDHDILVEIHAAVCGINGQGGLLREHKKLSEDYYRFKRYVLITASFLVGSGILGTGIMALIKSVVK